VSTLRPTLSAASVVLLAAGALLGAIAVPATADAADGADAADVVDAPTLDYVPDPDVSGVADVPNVDAVPNPESPTSHVLTPLLRCDPETFYRVTGGGYAQYKSWGPAAGKYNGGRSARDLTYSITSTTKRSSSIEVGGTISLDVSIANIELNTSYTVTKEASTDKTVTDSLSVPSHYYGYVQPKVEYRDFDVTHVRRGANCHETILAESMVHAITAVPFWSECIGTSPCTPKP
jgi:hypothetical protein